MITKLFRLCQKVSLYAGNSCRKLRLRLLYPGIFIDRNSVIEGNCRIVCVDGGKLEIRNTHICEGVYLFADINSQVLLDNCFVGRYTHIAAKQSISIGSGTMIAEMVVIRDQDHAKENQDDSMLSGYNIAPINIGTQVWVASKATILKGVSIGDRAVIAASAVVNKHVAAGELWGGIPARFIKLV